MLRKPAPKNVCLAYFFKYLQPCDSFAISLDTKRSITDARFAQATKKNWFSKKKNGRENLISFLSLVFSVNKNFAIRYLAMSQNLSYSGVYFAS